MNFELWLGQPATEPCYHCVCGAWWFSSSLLYSLYKWSFEHQETSFWKSILVHSFVTQLMLCVQSWGILQAQQQGEGIILISFPSWLDSWKHIQLFGGILVHLSTPFFFLVDFCCFTFTWHESSCNLDKRFYSSCQQLKSRVMRIIWKWIVCLVYSKTLLLSLSSCKFC